jgi:hypothetical protein
MWVVPVHVAVAVNDSDSVKVKVKAHGGHTVGSLANREQASLPRASLPAGEVDDGHFELREWFWTWIAGELLDNITTLILQVATIDPAITRSVRRLPKVVRCASNLAQRALTSAEVRGSLVTSRSKAETFGGRPRHGAIWEGSVHLLYDTRHDEPAKRDARHIPRTTHFRLRAAASCNLARLAQKQSAPDAHSPHSSCNPGALVPPATRCSTKQRAHPRRQEGKAPRKPPRPFYRALPRS